MTTRAQYILALLSEEDSLWKPLVANAADVDARMQQSRVQGPFAHAIVPLAAAGSALTLGTNAAQIHALNKQRNAKIAQTGVGQQYQQAKSQLGSMRKRHLLTLGVRPGLAGKIQAQKALVKDIQNKGLHQYHMGQTVTPVTRSQ